MQGRAHVSQRDLDGLPVPGGPSKYVAVMVVDVVGFGRRKNSAQSEIRRRMYGIVERELHRSGIDRNRCYHFDRGDGILMAIPAAVCTMRLVDPLLDNLGIALRSHNRLSVQEVQIRLRIALHVGPVHCDTRGLFGSGVILPFRLLDAPTLRDPELYRRDVTLIASDAVYEDVLLHEDHQAEYRCVEVKVKETDTRAWVRLRP